MIVTGPIKQEMKLGFRLFCPLLMMMVLILSVSTTAMGSSINDDAEGGIEFVPQTSAPFAAVSVLDQFDAPNPNVFAKVDADNQHHEFIVTDKGDTTADVVDAFQSENVCLGVHRGTMVITMKPANTTACVINSSFKTNDVNEPRWVCDGGKVIPSDSDGRKQWGITSGMYRSVGNISEGLAETVVESPPPGTVFSFQQLLIASNGESGDIQDPFVVWFDVFGGDPITGKSNAIGVGVGKRSEKVRKQFVIQLEAGFERGAFRTITVIRGKESIGWYVDSKKVYGLDGLNMDQVGFEGRVWLFDTGRESS
eukprot:TRINITY_DN2218_c0_g2_i2.p1 TRINITY_DN2218_c0_g2~~TRINITY_DN2218_c0_g2_i2.p1  ORF type:complete len:310 (-),score=88.06 TRINITY_DN2218_c0_g2_i2:88-1017(-)